MYDHNFFDSTRYLACQSCIPPYLRSLKTRTPPNKPLTTVLLAFPASLLASGSFVLQPLLQLGVPNAPLVDDGAQPGVLRDVLLIGGHELLVIAVRLHQALLPVPQLALQRIPLRVQRADLDLDLPVPRGKDVVDVLPRHGPRP